MNRPFRLIEVPSALALLTASGFLSTCPLAESLADEPLFEPLVTSVEVTPGNDVVIVAEVPAGYRYALLQSHAGTQLPSWDNSVVGVTNGARSTATFTLPGAGAAPNGIYRVEVGTSTTPPGADFSGPQYLSLEYPPGSSYLGPEKSIAQTLNRITYGPNPGDYAKIQSMGIPAFISEQLNPHLIDESGNERLNDAIDELFNEFVPFTGESLLAAGSDCRYFKGTQEPPAEWTDPDFLDTGWEQGITGLGYGDDDDATVLDDMPSGEGNPGYYSVYLRQQFEVADPLLVNILLLRIRYDDAFVAYLNGTEIARDNVQGAPPAFDTPASTFGGNVDNSGAQVDFNINDFRDLLVTGTNTLAVQVHNHSLTSSDCSINPELVNMEDPVYQSIAGVRELQHLIHLRGVYSQKQLQAVLGEFWENHFTTDFDKVEDTIRDMDEFEALDDIDPGRARAQAATEAVRMEWEEYEFFYKNALGNFGDMLLYSATSPSMLIYLDNILNGKDAPNENYSREIMELSAFGVDNRYTQEDIEELARCFTGWTIRKVFADLKQPFPDSALNPPVTPSVLVESEGVAVDLGINWKYFKGTAEPSPGTMDEPTTAWTLSSFDDGDPLLWLTGPSGVGYGDGDDATELLDMEDNYSSVYLRAQVVIPGPETGVDDVVLEIDYDDGFVAYLNGTEIARSGSMNGNGTPPAFDETSGGNHEAGSRPMTISLLPFQTIINQAPATNTLAIQGHNTSLGSSDFSILPRVLTRTYSADSIAITDPHGLWTFRFDPEDHDTGPKVLFPNTPHVINIPGGTEGVDGVNDALQVINAMVDHPSTSEFIVLKLVNRFVSDGISLATYKDRTAPGELLLIMDEAIAAWHSTQPAGNIATVMGAILDPTAMASAFWLESSHTSKVKTSVELIHSGFRALDADITSGQLYRRNEDMGMTLFKRDAPDGYSELGIDWVDTLSLLERMSFAQALGSNLGFSYSSWDIDATMSLNGISNPDEMVEYFDGLLFSSSLSVERKTLLLDYANTDDDGLPSPFETLSANAQRTRLGQVVGLILALPEFQYQ